MKIIDSFINSTTDILTAETDFEIELEFRSPNSLTWAVLWEYDPYTTWFTYFEYLASGIPRIALIDATSTIVRYSPPSRS